MAIPESEDGDFIEGIFNYCDRWCERCAMTTRCRQYAMECARDAFNADGSQDGDSSEFMEALLCLPDEPKSLDDYSEDSEDETVFEIEEASADLENDIDDFDVDEYMAEREKAERQTSSTPCVKLADRYMGDGTRWLDEWEILLDQLDEKHEADVKDACEVIGWYVFQIPTKLRRAINGHLRQESYLEDDVNGSAKVVLIGCDNSLEAWLKLQKCLPTENRDAIDPLVRMLRELILEIEKELPKARDFKRPGFED